MSFLLSYLSQSDAGINPSNSLEPVALATVVSQARMDLDAGDLGWVETVLIPGARQLAETRTGSAIRLGRYRQTMSDFPRSGVDPVTRQRSFQPFLKNHYTPAIRLANGLVQSVESMSYVDSNGDTQSFDMSTVTLVQIDAANCELTFKKPGNYWPESARVSNAVTINYTAGATPDDFQSRFPSVVQWICLACAWGYLNRELFVTEARGFTELPVNFGDALLMPLQVRPIF